MIDHTIYQVYCNTEGYWEAAILSPKSETPSIHSGEDTAAETVAAVEAHWGLSAKRVPTLEFQREVEARATHTPGMLALLSETYAGDLRSYWVYGSILRPMSGVYIEGAIILNMGGVRYKQWVIYDYVVVPGPLEESVIRHYDFVLISHP